MSTGRGIKRFETLSEDHAYVALGSNVGDRVGNIEWACHELDCEGLTVTRTSALYETAPMYQTAQERFVNGVCEIRTGAGLPQSELLKRLKAIERRMGREKTIDKGPRNIDLDILLYGSRVFESTELSVPHKAMLEREFVLRPLSDLIPNTSHPTFPGFTYSRRLARLESQGDSPMPSITTLSSRLPTFMPSIPTRNTHLMAVLNLTPDSFSDGGEHPLSDPSALLPTCRAFTASGATILDIGGQSTRPRAPEVSSDEECARALPIIQLLRSLPEFDHVAISIDTYRASVARAAIVAGADIVNDVSAGTLDPAMLSTCAELGCGVMLMHMRGDPSTMTTQTNYPTGVVAGVANELRQRVDAALAAGVRRWRIALDPGIGFAKNVAQNLELLRRLAELRQAEGLCGFPWLVGTSRKSFIGKLTGVAEARERKLGTAAAVSAAVQGGADVVRVHDVREMAQVVAVADAIWRVESQGRYSA